MQYNFHNIQRFSKCILHMNICNTYTLHILPINNYHKVHSSIYCVFLTHAWRGFKTRIFRDNPSLGPVPGEIPSVFGVLLDTLLLPVPTLAGGVQLGILTLENDPIGLGFGLLRIGVAGALARGDDTLEDLLET